MWSRVQSLLTFSNGHSHSLLTKNYSAACLAFCITLILYYIQETWQSPPSDIQRLSHATVWVPDKIPFQGVQKAENLGAHFCG